MAAEPTNGESSGQVTLSIQLISAFDEFWSGSSCLQ